MMSRLVPVLAFITLFSLVVCAPTWYNCPVYTNQYVPSNATSMNDLVNQQVQAHLNSVLNQINSDTQNTAFMADLTLDANTMAALEATNAGVLQAQCAHIPTPLDYSATNGTKINIFVKRMVKDPNTPKPALYLLNGGPGGSSDGLDDIMYALFKLVGDKYDIYVPEHRGVGRSTRVSCVAPQAETLGSDGGIPITDAEMTYCAFEFSNSTNTAKYSAPDAARDVLGLIQTVKGASALGQFVYGISYGTMWATRIMQLPGASNIVSGVILDSVMSTAAPASTPTLRTTFDQWDARMNSVGLDFLTRCGNDTFCQSKVTTDPVGYTATLFQNLFINYTCPAIAPNYNLTADSLRTILGSFLMSRTLRELVPALLYRLHRCDADLDVPTLQYFFDTLRTKYGQAPTCQQLGSIMLFNNIIFSEIWTTQPTNYDTLYQFYNTTYFATGSYKSAGVKANSNWPLYNPGPEFFNMGFNTTVPVLLLNGDLDPQTPLEFAQTQYANNIVSPSKKLIVFPGGVHGIIINTPVNNTEPKVACGMQIIVSFLQNNGDLSKLDLSCQNYISPISYKGSSDLNQALFGVNDIFEDAYEPPEVVKTVNLYLFIGVEAGTAVLAIVVVCCLVYYIVQLRDKESQYEDIDAERH